MAKLTLQDVPSGFNSGPTISANNTLVEAAVENTLSRDGTSPNDMEVDLDMGGHRITNLAAPVEDSDAVRYIDIIDGVEIIQTVPWDEVTGKPTNVVTVGNLVDPNADRILFWDDSAGTLTYLTIGTNLSITGTTLDAASGGGGGAGPDQPPGIPNAMDDEFSAGSLDVKWVWRNQSTATWTQAQSNGVLTGLPISTAVHRMIEQTFSATGRWRAKFLVQNTSSAISGFGVRRNANNANMTIGAQGNTSGLVTKWSDSSFNSNPASFTVVAALYRYYEIELDGTNIIFRSSQVGVDGTFVQHFSEPVATFLGGAPDRFFFYVNQQNFGAPASQLIVDWFRKIA